MNRKLPVCKEGEEHHIHDHENGEHEALAGPVQQRGLCHDDHDNVAEGSGEEPGSLYYSLHAVRGLEVLS